MPRVEEPEPGIALGLSVQLAPLGSPATLRLVVELNPLIAVTVATLPALLPWFTETDEEDVVSEKSGFVLTWVATKALKSMHPQPVTVSQPTPALDAVPLGRLPLLPEVMSSHTSERPACE